MNGAVAYNMFEDQYSDAQHDVLPIVRIKPKRLLENEDFSSGEELELDEGKGNQVLVLPVKEVSNDRYKVSLRKPIPIYLEGKNRQYIAMHEESRICGEGQDAQAAFRDFEASFVSVYLSYRDSKDLSPGAKEYAGFLSQLVAKIEEV